MTLTIIGLKQTLGTFVRVVVIVKYVSERDD